MAVRPRHWQWEALEARVTPSRATVGFGAVGDSLTDEYRFYRPDRSTARNWVETLAATRPVSFGAYSTASRGEPRDQGYASNWARSDATSRDVVANQVRGLARQVRSGQVTYASVNMGSNDFLGYFRQTAEAAVAGSAPTAADFAAGLATVVARAEANFDATVSTLLLANPRAKVVVATLPPINRVPLVAQATRAASGLALAADSIATAEVTFNDHVRLVAAAFPGRVAVADIGGLGEVLPTPPLAVVPFGGTQVDFAGVGNDFHQGTVADGIHPGTVEQGLIANAVVAAADTLGASIALLSPTEIVHRARTIAARPGTVR